jgi:hypothetical protein
MLSEVIFESFAGLRWRYCCTVSLLTGDTVTQGLAADETVALCRRAQRLPFALRGRHLTKCVEALLSDERP